MYSYVAQTDCLIMSLSHSWTSDTLRLHYSTICSEMKTLNCYTANCFCFWSSNCFCLKMQVKVFDCCPNTNKTVTRWTTQQQAASFHEQMLTIDCKNTRRPDYVATSVQRAIMSHVTRSLAISVNSPSLFYQAGTTTTCLSATDSGQTAA